MPVWLQLLVTIAAGLAGGVASHLLGHESRGWYGWLRDAYVGMVAGLVSSWGVGGYELDIHRMIVLALLGGAGGSTVLRHHIAQQLLLTKHVHGGDIQEVTAPFRDLEGEEGTDDGRDR